MHNWKGFWLLVHSARQKSLHGSGTRAQTILPPTQRKEGEGCVTQLSFYFDVDVCIQCLSSIRFTAPDLLFCYFLWIFIDFFIPLRMKRVTKKLKLHLSLTIDQNLSVSNSRSSLCLLPNLTTVNCSVGRVARSFTSISCSTWHLKYQLQSAASVRWLHQTARPRTTGGSFDKVGVRVCVCALECIYKCVYARICVFVCVRECS